MEEIRAIKQRILKELLSSGRIIKKGEKLKSKKYTDFLLEELKNPKIAAEYLNSCLDEDDPQLILLALKDIAQAMGSITELANKTNSHRVTLHRALSENGNPEFKTFIDILRALKIRFIFKSVKAA